MIKVKIGNMYVGDGEPTFIIAEGGLNHNGDIDIAKELIKEAKKCGADAIKFQSYHTEDFISKKSEYYKLFKDLELSEEEFYELKKYAEKIGIMFISTPLDLKYVDILNNMNVPAFKIASGDLTFHPLLEKVAKTGKPVILSTGMANIGEIWEAVDVLKNNGCKEIILLHCISSYPTPYEEVNLHAIKTLKKIFNIPVGYSDHTLGILTPIVSVALGAGVVEKHFTLDKSMEGPDHALSADPEEFKEMVEKIRLIEKMLGTGDKIPMPSEKEVIVEARRSIVAKRDIKKGCTLTIDNISFKRPARGIETKYWKLILNRKIKNDKREDEIIYWDDLLGD
ncbi:N-acetylneuraminate synthase [Methanocaldococcus lauensis]|uniref:N-acetylneuraminate synthase n=1 Tax=Methanocaldococcus lauensis TaxID=2546128 RepID=A0A8D6PZF8_9EURY|nr:N-acetylneuraminate synthase family protein [Methanocaldococcus lauensis]CAB3290126.1 N-acetylneuraminate synthase [Methanocaldococcus lauensis]